MRENIGRWSIPVLLLAGCATAQAPQELVSAREAYTTSQQSAAAQYDPAGLHEAQVALERAEQLFRDDADSSRTRDAAYVALRRAERAQAEGETAALELRKREADRAAAQAQAKTVEEDQQKLSAAREQLERVHAERVAAEQRAEQALARLKASQAAAVQQKPQGTVITLPGSVLFASDKSTLLPTGSEKLDKVAEALREQAGAKLRIEGHTDSTGTDAYNMQLSKLRAESVAEFLVSRGVPRDQITTAGVGSTQPVADNSTPEGRANNRRVEITIQRIEPK